MPKTHNHKDWIRFLKLIDGRTPKDKALHLIMDNYSAHKTPDVKAWLAKHPRFHVHFTPTSSSWLNQVERFFRDVTDKCIRRGVFHSVTELQQARVDDQGVAGPCGGRRAAVVTLDTGRTAEMLAVCGESGPM
jgi:DDE superfamily endonuclease